MRRYSACIEWLFAEEGDSFADRIRRAHAGGLTAVEFWRWTDKDLDAIESALDEAGLEVTSLVAEPMVALTDAANRQAWLAGLAESVAVARRLGAPVLIAQAGATSRASAAKNSAGRSPKR
ncbi:UNVERIFIED_ORG: sugar phosphate isomerase/epimerase [Rhizobium esperanzae]|nr:sugar phosphate isomerase/epimerase [Rhizobium esperanzae]